MKFKKILTGILVTSTILTSVPVYAEALDYSTIENTKSDQSTDTDFSTDIDSDFKVTIPKLVKLQNSADNDYSSDYNIKIMDANIRPDEYIQISTATEFNVIEQVTNRELPATNDIDKNSDLTSRIRYSYTDGESSTYTGYVEAKNLSAGDWEGILNFRVALGSSFIDVISSKVDGKDINAIATIENTKELEDSLVESMNVNKDNICGIINVSTDQFKGEATTQIDVSKVVTDDCKKFDVYHYDTKTNKWEYIDTVTADENGIIEAKFVSFSPVAIVSHINDGSIIIEKGEFQNKNITGYFWSNQYPSTIIEDASKICSTENNHFVIPYKVGSATFYDLGYVDVTEYSKIVCTAYGVYSGVGYGIYISSNISIDNYENEKAEVKLWMPNAGAGSETTKEADISELTGYKHIYTCIKWTGNSGNFGIPMYISDLHLEK